MHSEVVAYLARSRVVQDSVVGIHVWDSKLTIAFIETNSARREEHLVVLSYELNLRTQRVRLFPRAEYSNANWKILHPTATPIGMHYALSLLLLLLLDFLLEHSH